MMQYNLKLYFQSKKKKVDNKLNLTSLCFAIICNCGIIAKASSHIEKLHVISKAVNYVCNIKARRIATFLNNNKENNKETRINYFIMLKIISNITIVRLNINQILFILIYITIRRLKLH